MDESALATVQIAHGFASYNFPVAVQFFPKIALSFMGLLINRHDLPSLSRSGHYRTF